MESKWTIAEKSRVYLVVIVFLMLLIPCFIVRAIQYVFTRANMKLVTDLSCPECKRTWISPLTGARQWQCPNCIYVGKAVEFDPQEREHYE